MAKYFKMYRSEAGTPQRREEKVLIALSALTLIVNIVSLVMRIRLADNDD